jgi:hypothetical protein
MLKLKQISWAIAALVLSAAALAQKPVIYPAKSQSASQQSKDDGECQTWAKQNTGVDPSKPPPAAQTAAAPPPPKGGVVKGAAVGATVGAIGGNDVGNAAAKGAVIGGVAQHSRKKGQAEATAAQNQQAQASQQQAMATFYKAFGACMEGRGYTVK